MKGRANAGDPGAGIFEWQENSLATPDDATVVLPNAHSSSSSGRWIRQVDVRGPVHAEWFGAIGDGSADDSTAIQDCLDTFGRVRLLARTYRINTPIKVQSSYIIEGEGIDKTVIVNRDTTTGSRLSAFTNLNDTTPAHHAVIRDLTIDCGYDQSGKGSTMQAIALKGENILVERVKAKNFNVGSSNLPCTVIELTNSGNTTKMGAIQDCEVTAPGNNSSVSESQPITCLFLGGQTGASGSYQGVGGRIVRNKLHDIPYTGATGAQHSPVRGITFWRCKGLEAADNEIANVDGWAVCLTAPSGGDYGHNDCIIRANRMITVSGGVYLELLYQDGTLHTGLRVFDNLITLGKTASGTLFSPSFGVYCYIANVASGTSILKDLYVTHNYIQGSTVDSVVPKGVWLKFDAQKFQNLHIEDNLIETKDHPAGGGFGLDYEESLVLKPPGSYSTAGVSVHGNRNLAGTDLRLKVSLDAGPQWGPYTARLARYQSPAFDGRVGLATEEFLGQGNTFALGWTSAVTGSGQVSAQSGQAGHPGIVQLTTGSSTTASAMLRYGSNGVVLGTGMTHVLESGAKRNRNADSAENYECRLGLMQATGNKGVYFKVSYSGSNDNYIVAMAVADNGTTSSSITATSDTMKDKDGGRIWRAYRLEVGANAAGQLEARFFVNGEYLGTIPSTYIPVTSTLLCGFKVDWLAGSADKGMLVDYFQHQVTPA